MNSRRHILTVLDMLVPRKMSKVLIIGAKPHLEATIELTHRMNTLHIVDFVQQNNDFAIGRPMRCAHDISEKLLKLRSMAKVLEIGEDPPVGKRYADSQLDAALDKKLRELEDSIRHEGEEKAALESAVRETQLRVEAIMPFANMGLDMSQYRGYNSLKVRIGTLEMPPEAFEPRLAKITRDYEVLFTRSKQHYMAVFYKKEDEKAVEKLLFDSSFTDVAIPDEEGDPARIMATLMGKMPGLGRSLEKSKRRITQLRKEHADFIMACEEHLSIEVQKAESPLRFATTANSFIIEGWVPKRSLAKFKMEMLQATHDSLHIEEVEPSPEERKETPVLLDNPPAVKPFENLVEMYSTPNYRELDPALVLSLVFPFFFGLIIGDLGYGLVMLGLGLGMFAYGRKRGSDSVRDLGWYLGAGGLFASIIGLFVFAEAFGVPFHPVGGEEYSWEGVVYIPIHHLIPKLEMGGVVMFLYISIIAAFTHMGLGLVFGFRNEIGHNPKHALAKVGWFLVLIAGCFVCFSMAKDTPMGAFFWRHALGYAGNWSVRIAGIDVPVFAMVSGAIGVVIIIPTEGFIGVLELPSMAASIISYTRLAAIGVSKGAMALAFNTIALPLVLSGQVGLVIAGIFLLLLLHGILFAQGALAAGIQALRLHYVEFFQRFYIGEGRRFTPFGAFRRYTSAK